MDERQRDLQLGIRTIGIREWKNEDGPYNRYEATPYLALDRLFENYTLPKDARLVDFGCGRGRVSFYVHYHYDIPVVGIENNDQTFDELLTNEMTYERHLGPIDVPLYFEFNLAENYEIQTIDNVFYFFNPFSLKIFRGVLQNILKSYEEHERQMDIIFYYPLASFKRVLDESPFTLINRIRVPEVGHGKHGEFLIYRLSVEHK